jgi:hypothetical protein
MSIGRLLENAEVTLSRIRAKRRKNNHVFAQFGWRGISALKRTDGQAPVSHSDSAQCLNDARWHLV